MKFAVRPEGRAVVPNFRAVVPVDRAVLPVLVHVSTGLDQRPERPWDMGPSLHAVILLALAVSCSHPPRGSVPATPPLLACPPGTSLEDGSTSDQGWDYPERQLQCLTPKREPEGPAMLFFEGAEGYGSTRLEGTYRHGRQVGRWSEYDVKSGARIGGFVLDGEGTGDLELRDQVGHVLRGHVALGEREGTWTYADRDGRVVATETYVHGHLTGESGSVPWNPPMLDPRDACPRDAGSRDADDGCP